MNILENLKDLLYITGSVLGIIGFYRTVKKREYTMFSYRTRYGNEVHPFLFCIRGNAYNVNITTKNNSVFAFRYSSTVNFSELQENKLGTDSMDKSSFYASISQGEALCIDNSKFNMGLIIIHFEDRYNNKYKQHFSFDKSLGDKQNKKLKSQRFYSISKRYWRFLWIWFPLRA